ncbi:c6 zinc finger domain containing protein [Niveomyces insectorum RCEF 264]|uniref:C6 zinc finger domain containing protein n=1 Tax=Niveomyces insectorum RCEF 264 TaxID=1081102 RepID=A0A167VPD1_9HYPO|nr:c6 zinc finger domain containing protein [Niveomyces insectorum RCEF 264]
MTDLANDPPARLARKRRRPAVVCAECRRRKIACDRKTPCGQCALHNVSCVYVTGAVPPPYGRPRRVEALGSPGDRRKETGGGSEPAARHSNSNGNINRGRGRASGGGSASGSSVGNSRHRAGGGGGGGGGGSGPDAVDLPPLGSPVSSSPGFVKDNPCGERPRLDTMVPLDGQSQFTGRLAKTRMFGQSHWMNNMDEFQLMHSLTHLVHFVTGSSIYKSMRTCKRIARVIKADEKQRIAAPTREGDPPWFTPPPRAVADRLLDLYLNIYEPLFRVLHIPTFRQEYQQFMDAREKVGGTGSREEPASDLFMVKLVLVLALGSCFYEGPDNLGSAGAAHSADVIHDDLRVAAARAIHKLDVAGGSPPLDKHHLNLDMLQVCCLVNIARQSTALEIGDDLNWFSAGALLHAAFGMGLNRDPSHFQSLSFAQCELRRRLWATILELVVQASLDQGMPPLISVDDYDCSPPLNLDDDAFVVGEEDKGMDNRTANKPPSYNHNHTNTTVDCFSAKEGREGSNSNGMDAAGAAAAVPQQPSSSSSSSPLPRPPTAGQPDSVFTQTSIQRLLCRSLPVRLAIAKALNGLSATLSYDRALQLSSELLDTCRYSVSLFKTAPTTVSVPPEQHVAYARLRIAFYELLTRRFHHSLHSPFARKAATNVQYFYSRRARLETALRLLSFSRPSEDRQTYQHHHTTPVSHHTTPAAAVAAASAAAAAAAAASYSANSGNDHAKVPDLCRRLWLVGRGLVKCTLVDIKATVIMELIRQLQEDYVPDDELTVQQRELYDTVLGLTDLAQERVAEFGETNVKGYIFFRGALGQVDALLAGSPVRPTMVSAAESAAETMMQTLRQRAARKGVVVPEVMLAGGCAGDDLDPSTVAPVELMHIDGAPGTTAGTTVGGEGGGGGGGVGGAEYGGDSSGGASGGSGNASDPSLTWATAMAEAGAMPPATSVTPRGTNADFDPTMHLPTPDMSLAGSNSTVGGTAPDNALAWPDDWILDPQGELGFANWFFPYNDRINTS